MTDPDLGSAALSQLPNRLDTYRYSVTLLLMLAYTLNCADRTLIAIIGQPLKLDLQLSDTEFGLLVGTAFAALYAFSGIPIARLAERFNRVNILFLVMIAWSALTALCATAVGFTQLLFLRMGVGVAEAGCSPPAHSLISDYFEPRQRATALSIYSCGISLGYILSAVAGGYVAERYGWRAACIVVGLPGVVLAVLIRGVIREPPREQAPRARAASRQPSRVARELHQLAAVIRVLVLRWCVANFVLGVTIASFASQGAWAFIPAYFNRAFGLDYATIGFIAALTGGVAVGIGLMAGGLIADLLGGRNTRWYAFVPAIGLLICTPIYVGAFLQANWQMTAILLGVAGFFQYLSFGPTFGVVQNVVGARQRATATALIYVVLNVVALGGGALFTGWLIDRFAEFNFRHPPANALIGYLDALRHSSIAGGSRFRAACPGGQALAAASGAAHALCRTTLSLSSREGILITVLLYTWAAIHYLLGAIGLGSELRAAKLRDAVLA
ncbi:MAG TPA: MFS transporter [Steroidobacteraceae bacterium]